MDGKQHGGQLSDAAASLSIFKYYNRIALNNLMGSKHVSITWNKVVKCTQISKQFMSNSKVENQKLIH